MNTLLDVDVGVMIGRREICGLGTLGVTASLASAGNRISFARAKGMMRQRLLCLTWPGSFYIR